MRSIPILLALAGALHAGGASAQATGAQDSFHVTIPTPAQAMQGATAVVMLRNPNFCGQMSYNAFLNTYTDMGALCSTAIRAEVFNGFATTTCPLPGPSNTIAAGAVHRLILNLPPPLSGFNAQPVTLSIEYQGFVGANAHLEADLWVYETGDPSTGIGTRLASAIQLSRRGIR
jgi:hypothetical protein